MAGAGVKASVLVQETRFLVLCPLKLDAVSVALVPSSSLHPKLNCTPAHFVSWIAEQHAPRRPFSFKGGGGGAEAN